MRNEAFLRQIPEVYSVPKGMALSVFENKYARVKRVEQRVVDGKSVNVPVYQDWEERITDVVQGNFSLDPRMSHIPTDKLAQAFSSLGQVDADGDGPWMTNFDTPFRYEYEDTLRLSKKGVMAYSGRHLQHGDLNQRDKTGELFTNCSTAMFSWALFYLLLKGSGVGRDYSSDICWVDWEYLPECRFVLEGPNQHGTGGHPDYEPWIESLQAAQHKYDTESEKVRWFKVADSAEGWVKVIQIMETAAFHKNNRDHLFVFDFSEVRAKGSPIRGQQNRPSSGPVPLIDALNKVSKIKGSGMKPWKQALFIDDYLASCVAVGGIRRSARMATKHWKDKDVIEFADIKREGFLRSANNSILVDKEFWEHARSDARGAVAVHARRVFAAASEAAFRDDTGEPGLINVDMLTWSDDKIDTIQPNTYISAPYYSKLGGIHAKSEAMMAYVLDKAKQKKYRCIVNPCSEIVLAVYGGYCVIGDLCGTWASTLDEFREACRLMPRTLIRTNMMSFMYDAEVKRTNRIGVGLIGIFELAWNHFGITVKDIIRYDSEASRYIAVAARNTMSGDLTKEQFNLLDMNNKEDPSVRERVRQFSSFMEECLAIVEKSANDYSDELGINRPHTYVTTKPAGTGAKVMNSTEAANLPSQNVYLRNVQYSVDDPQYHALRDRGYPWRDVSNQYSGHHVIGFPTKQLISEIMGGACVTASDLSPEEHFAWLRWLETRWLGGTGKNNQISYTMKYTGDRVDFAGFKQLLLDHQSSVRCCSWMKIMSADELSKFAYLPEESISYAKYQELMSRIDVVEKETVSDDDLQCADGACPIEPNQMVDLQGKNIDLSEPNKGDGFDMGSISSYMTSEVDLARQSLLRPGERIVQDTDPFSEAKE